MTLKTATLLQAPGWWKTPLMGPAFSSGMVGAVKEPKSPGCNGGVFGSDNSRLNRNADCPRGTGLAAVPAAP